MLGWLKKSAKWVKGYLRNDAVALDQLGNAVLTRGSPDETISTHSQIAADQGNRLGRGMSKVLHIFQKDHGNRAKGGDRRRAVEEINRIDGDVPPDKT